MAIWQNSFFICPNTDIINFPLLSIDDIESIWDKNKIDISITEYFESILDKNDSWCNNILLFGKEESNCIEVFHNNSIIKDISIRIDFRTKFKRILEKIITYNQIHNFFLISENMTNLNNDLMLIKQNIINSKQYKKYIEFVNIKE